MASKYQMKMLNPKNSRTASAIFFGGLKTLRSPFRFGNQARMNGVNTRIAIALLPHQIFHDCSNDLLKPK